MGVRPTQLPPRTTVIRMCVCATQWVAIIDHCPWLRSGKNTCLTQVGDVGCVRVHLYLWLCLCLWLWLWLWLTQWLRLWLWLAGLGLRSPTLTRLPNKFVWPRRNTAPCQEGLFRRDGAHSLEKDLSKPPPPKRAWPAKPRGIYLDFR